MKKEAKLALTLSALAFLGNLANLTLFNSVSFIFGSIFGLMAIRLLGLYWGLAVTLVGASYTILAWGHPYAAMTQALEALFVGIAMRRTDNLALADALFWIMLGFGVVMLAYVQFLGLSVGSATYIGFKQAINGVFNAVFAGLLLSLLHGAMPSVRMLSPPVSVKSLLFYMVVFVAIISSAALIVTESRTQYRQIIRQVDVIMSLVANAAVQAALVGNLDDGPRENLIQHESPLLQFNGGEIDPMREIAITIVDPNGVPRDVMGISKTFGRNGALLNEFSTLTKWEPTRDMPEMLRSRESRYLLDLPMPGSDDLRQVRVEISAAPVIDALEAAGRRSLLLLLATVVLVMPISYVLITWLTRPLSKLTASSSGLADAILSGRSVDLPPPSSVVEYDTLSTILGQMARSLNHNFREKEQLARSLEVRVLDRTAQLDLMSQVAQQASNPIVITDTDGRITWVNFAFEDLTGYSLTEVAGHRPGHILQKEPVPPELIEHMQTSLARGEGFHVELLNHTRQGKPYWVEIRCTPLLDRDGNHIGFIAIENDITRRREIDSELEASLERLRLATEVAELGIWSYDPNTRESEWNAGNYDLHGIDPNAPDDVTTNWLKRVDPEDIHQIGSLFGNDLVHADGDFAFEYRLNHPEKGERFMVAVARAVVAEGEVIRITGVTRDVTEERRANAKVRAAAQHTAAILDNVIDAVIAINTEGQIISYNHAAERMFGYKSQDIIGRDIGILMERDHERAHKSYLRNYLQAGTRTVMGRLTEITAVRNNGEVFPIQLAVSEVKNDDQHFYIGIVRETTQQRQLEEQLRQSQKLEAVGQLTGGIAHDFNNLLTVILGNAEMLVECLGDNSELRRLAEMTMTAAERGAELTNRLLSFSRRQPLAPKLISVNDLLLGLGQLLRHSIGEHVEISFALSELPCMTEVDAGQLESAILNLALNARDSMSKGGRLTIRTACVELDADNGMLPDDLQPGSYALVSVTDTGCGMSTETLAHAFEPFFTTKEVGKGSGLGLSMVFGFVKQSGGHIVIVSEPGEGTEIKLYFPCSRKLSPGAAG